MDDEAEFRELVLRRGDALVRTGFLLTGDWARGEDLAQSALATTWTHWRTLRAPEAAEAYTRRTMARLASAWWRRRWHAEIPTEAPPERLVPSPYDAVDVADSVTRALATLTPRQRAVVVLRYFDDLTEAATAEALGCAVGTVKSTTSTALARLRALDIWDSALTGDAS